jgi:hypothetical protein
VTDPLFKRTGGADFPDKLKVLVTGPPKSGKTTLLATVPNIVIADTEPDSNNLMSIAHRNIPYVTVRSSEDLQRFKFVMVDPTMRQKAAEQLGMPAIEAVAIDTLDTLQAIMKRERIRETRQTQFLRDDWGWIKEEMTEIVGAFTALPIHVFFIVHNKTKEIGKGDDARTIVLPGLEGSIDAAIAGMVGYSLYAFRKQELRADGSAYTKYWLRAEGDENFDFVGNRAGGRLPDIIEPDFATIYKAAMSGRPAVQPTQAPKPIQIQTPVQNAAQQQVPAQQAPAQAQKTEQPSVAPPAPAPAATAGPVSGPPNDDNEPVNVAALQHVKGVYDSCSLDFPEDIIKGITMGDARQLVRIWKSINRDHLDGKGAEGETPQSEMALYLASSGWMTADDLAEWESKIQSDDGPPAVLESAGVEETVEIETTPEPEARPEPEKVEPRPDLNGTIKQVLAYVGDNKAKVQEAYDSEIAGQQRSTLLAELVNRGATPVQTDVQNDEAPQAETVVTSEAQPADGEPTEQQAIETLQEGLGTTVLDQVTNPDAPCEECGNPVDDPDIAELSKSRFERWLCVADYIAETKKPRESVSQ